jgi:predicted transcriptional regulator
MEQTTETPQAAVNQELLDFFKVLADANRLKIIGLLAAQSYTVEQLAEILHLGASTVSHHLSRLNEAGLVSARAEGYYNYYSLQTNILEEMARRLLSRQTLTALAPEVDVDAFDKKVLRDFLAPDGRIKAFPAQEKKFLAVLRYALRDFEEGRQYSEKEVNEILSRYHEDTASLRRAFIDYRYMARQAGIYWRI